MLAWRLCRERYAKLDGVGAAKAGGRWNPPALPALQYRSARCESRTLSAMQIDRSARLKRKSEHRQRMELFCYSTRAIPYMPTARNISCGSWVRCFRSPTGTGGVFPMLTELSISDPVPCRSSTNRPQNYMPFWFPAQVAGNSVSSVRGFQDDLKRGWYRYIERQTGVPVVSHERETGWPPVARGG